MRCNIPSHALCTILLLFYNIPSSSSASSSSLVIIIWNSAGMYECVYRVWVGTIWSPEYVRVPGCKLILCNFQKVIFYFAYRMRATADDSEDLKGTNKLHIHICWAWDDFKLSHICCKIRYNALTTRIWRKTAHKHFVRNRIFVLGFAPVT